MNAPSAPLRLRVTYAHGQGLRYISHLDLIRVFERAMRRARLPLAYTQGFNARPRISMAAPLPVGMAGERELADFYLLERVPADEFRARLSAQLPSGLSILFVEETPRPWPALASLVRAARYRAELPAHLPFEEVRRRVEELLRQPTLPRTRRAKKGRPTDYDLRPLILELEASPGPEGPIVRMTLSALPGATGRPEEVLAALDCAPAEASIVREELILEAGEKAHTRETEGPPPAELGDFAGEDAP
ncbi:MAG: TIGR03936 family radical SAM-associated protein [Anaerolineae bacterium]